jgi:hypothetical protein
MEVALKSLLVYVGEVYRGLRRDLPTRKYTATANDVAIGASAALVFNFPRFEQSAVVEPFARAPHDGHCPLAALSGATLTRSCVSITYSLACSCRALIS